MCPPALESLDVWRQRVSTYTQGLLLQVTCVLEDDFDYESMQAGEIKLKNLIKSLMAEQGGLYPGLLFLQAGSCSLCKHCTYPDAACRFPEQAVPSLEAIGLVVTELCALADVPYYYGRGTLTYSGAVLLP